MKTYKKRIADQMLADKLEAASAVLVEGPKYCGKTTLSKQQAKSILSMADPDTLSQNLALARTNISRKTLEKLDKFTKRIIIEWIEKNLVDTENPRAHGKPLTANRTGQWRYRVGDYRIIALPKI